MSQALLQVVDDGPLKLRDVVADEIDYVIERRWLMNLSEEHVFGAPLSALCLSGGGVRSATYCLGLLRAFAQAGILKKFDYQSTVSGGGFAGAFISRWVRERGFKEVEKDLGNDKMFSEPFAALAHFRRYVSYLTPKLGLIGLDSLAGGILFLRNLFINWLVILPWIFAASLLPHLLAWIVSYFGDGNGDKSKSLIWIALACAATFFASYLVNILNRPEPYDTPNILPDAEDPPFNGLMQRFVWPAFVVVLLAILMLGVRPLGPHAFLDFKNSIVSQFIEVKADPLSLFRPNPMCSANNPLMTLEALQSQRQMATCNHSGLVEIVIQKFPQLVLLALVILALLFHAYVLTKRYKSYSDLRDKALTFAGSFVVAFLQVGFGLVAFLCLQLLVMPQDTKLAVFLAVISLPLILQFTYFVSDAIYNALFSRSKSSDMDQEWTARISGSLLSLPVAWAILSFIVLWIPLVWMAASSSDSKPQTGLGVLTGITSISGLISFILTQAGKAMENVNKGRQLWKEIGLRWGLTLFLGIFTISIVIQFSTFGVQSIATVSQLWVSSTSFQASSFLKSVPPPLLNVVVGLSVILLPLILAYTVDRFANLNKFSLHGIYRNRLTRSFVGAANPARTTREPGFLNLLSTDNISLASLNRTVQGPQINGPLVPPSFLVINMALNIPGSHDLSQQERKALPFTMTPKSCGSAALPLATGEGQFRSSGDYASCETKHQNFAPRPMSLGGAIAISGAAFDPAMGRFGSSAMRLLLTLVNVRLGAWLGNPGPAGQSTYKEKGPTLMIWPLAREFLGLANETDEYIHLSDGGHFENLATYEMLRRRCEFIVVVDAGCDPKYLFEDLGVLQRLARVDLNAEIKLPPGDLEKLKEGSKACSVGSVTYKDQNGEVTGTGIFCYIKPSMAPELQPAVTSYQRNSLTFPHETTLNQFFSESQFLAYLMLGESQGQEMVAAMRLLPDLKIAGWFP